jgi:hypothetical protein
MTVFTDVKPAGPSVNADEHVCHIILGAEDEFTLCGLSVRHMDFLGTENFPEAPWCPTCELLWSAES